MLRGTKGSYHNGVANNSGRIAKHIASWIESEELCDLDYATHQFLSVNYPLNRETIQQRLGAEDDGTTVGAGLAGDQELFPYVSFTVTVMDSQ